MFVWVCTPYRAYRVLTAGCILPTDSVKLGFTGCKTLLGEATLIPVPRRKPSEKTPGKSRFDWTGLLRCPGRAGR